jgi:hypothetical protein
MNNILHLDDIIHPNIGSAISMRPLIDSYIARYNQFAAKDIKLYSIKSKDNYVVHVMVPSEKNDEFEKPVFYDVIVEFYPTSKDIKEELTVKNYGVKVFSNSISWMFDFTYVFNKTNNIPEFIPKSYCSKTALKQPAKKTNPYGIYGIERVVFIALYHLEMITGYRKNRIDSILMPNMDTNSIVKMLMSQEQKFEQLNLEEKKLRLKKQKNKKIKQTDEINIINKKEKDVEKTINVLDKKFESDSLKGELKRNMKDKTMRSTMIAKVGSKSNLKSSLKK